MAKNARKWALLLLWGAIIVYGALCVYLYYMQSVQPLDDNNRYFQSDLPYHISMIIEDGWYYSFTAYIYQCLYPLGGTLPIAVFLSVVTVLCIVLSEQLLRLLLRREKGDILTLAAAFGLNFAMPFYWTFAGEYRYVSYQSGNLWHNSTYQCMKLAALAAMICYLKTEENYRQGITPGQWFSLSGLLFLCTGIKPSFLTVFAPVLAVKLPADLFRGVPFRRAFLLGSTVLPACAVMFWQQKVLFGADTGQGIEFKPWYTFALHANKTKLAVLCSIAFPLAVLLFSACELLRDKLHQARLFHAAIVSARELLRDRRCRFAWGMAGTGFLEALCLAETGSRSRDGNFLWGYCFTIFLIMLFSFEKWLLLREKREKSIFCKTAFAVSGCVLAYQLFCGIFFFARLLQGETYFMAR